MIKHSKFITILGYSGTANECPFDTETWGINIAGKYYKPKATSLGVNAFVQPKIDYCMAFDVLPPEYVREMKKIAPVISFQPYGDYPYPIEEIIRTFKTRYFVNSLCYMIAYAIFQGVRHLSLYGCDTLLGGEWQRESKGIEYWLGRAEERGMELSLPRKSGLLRSMQGRIYGREGREVLLTLAERLSLIKILPSNASYSDMLYASTLEWIFRLKGDEQDRYHILTGYDRKGNFTAICKEEFRVDIPMSEDVWNYLKHRILEYEKAYGLSSDLLGLYEMLTTSEWREGEYGKLDTPI